MDVNTLDAIGTVPSRFSKLAAYKAALLALPYVAFKLFKSNVPITPLTTLDALTEANFPGYAPLVVSSYVGPFLDPTKVAYMSTPLEVFACLGGGGGNSIYSCGLVTSTGAAATGTAGQTGGLVDSPAVTAGGSGYLLPPVVTITDATVGTGATAHAVLTAGVVTSIVIDDPGSGYTGPIVTIERPVRLECGASFASPLPMSAATDGIEVVLELDQGA